MKNLITNLHTDISFCRISMHTELFLHERQCKLQFSKLLDVADIWFQLWWFSSARWLITRMKLKFKPFSHFVVRLKLANW